MSDTLRLGASLLLATVVVSSWAAALLPCCPSDPSSTPVVGSASCEAAPCCLEPLPAATNASAAKASVREGSVPNRTSATPTTFAATEAGRSPDPTSPWRPTPQSRPELSPSAVVLRC